MKQLTDREYEEMERLKLKLNVIRGYLAHPKELDVINARRHLEDAISTVRMITNGVESRTGVEAGE